MAQLCRQLGHRLDMVHARGLGHAGSGGIHLHAGVGFHAQIARGQKENFLVGVRRGGLRSIAFDQQRRARLIPSRQVIEVGVLAVGHEIQLRFFRGEQNGDAALQFAGKGYAARVKDAGRLLVESVKWKETRSEGEESQTEKTELLHPVIVAPRCAPCKKNRARPQRTRIPYLGAQVIFPRTDLER